MSASKISIIVGISGASGAIYGIRTLEALRDANVETHLTISQMGAVTIAEETDYSPEQVQKLADYYYSPKELGACISSGSAKVSGMVIAPCSMRSLAEIATGVTNTILTRSADVMLKERRKLVLMTRETPLNSIHIQNMAIVTQAGGIIAPPVPAYYHHPETIDDIVNQTVGRVLDLFEIPNNLARRWEGLKTPDRLKARVKNC
jgi:flavin prenyltransferase